MKQRLKRRHVKLSAHCCGVRLVTFKLVSVKDYSLWATMNAAAADTENATHLRICLYSQDICPYSQDICPYSQDICPYSQDICSYSSLPYLSLSCFLCPSDSRSLSSPSLHVHVYIVAFPLSTSNGNGWDWCS